MEKLCISTFFILMSSLPLSRSLQCQAGLNYLSELGTDDNMMTEECSGPNQSCQRLEAIGIAFDFLNVTVVVNQCLNTTSCDEEEACMTLPGQFLLKEGLNIGVDPEQIQFEASTCEVACCYGNNCNNGTVSLIRETATSRVGQEGMKVGDLETTTPKGGAGHLSIKTFFLFVFTSMATMVIVT